MGLKPRSGYQRQEFSSIGAGKPMMIAEMASVEQDGSKSTWITEALQSMHAYPSLRAFVWFNQDKEADWRIECSPSAQPHSSQP